MEIPLIDSESLFIERNWTKLGLEIMARAFVKSLKVGPSQGGLHGDATNSSAGFLEARLDGTSTETQTHVPSSQLWTLLDLGPDYNVLN